MDNQLILKFERKFVNALLALCLMSLQKGKAVNAGKEERAQKRRLKKLMRSAYKIPFYRERFDRVGLKPEDFKTIEDLYKFPTLSKNELRQWMEEEVGKSQYEHYFLDTTSGSSGTPTSVYYSPIEKAWNMANWMRVLIRGGYNPFLGMTASRLSAHSVSAGQKNIFQKAGFLRREFINQYDPEKDVIAQINAIGPDLLYMNKTELMRVALYAKKNNIQVHHPKFLVPTGEMIDNQSRALFLEVFSEGLIDAYGAAELGSCMTRYPGTDFWRIQGDLFAVNICDDDGNPVEEGNLCITPLYRKDFPLINYLVGDWARYGYREDGSRIIAAILGRSNDFISHEDGTLTTFFMVAPIFARCKEIIQVRLIQKSFEDLVVQAVIDDALTLKQRDEVEQSILSQLNEKLKRPMNITFDWCDVIQPDANGKLRLIVNEMNN